MAEPSPLRVIQLSDTHFLDVGEEAEGTGTYDTSEAFEAVFAHSNAGADADLVVVTGDVADHGRIAQYRRAGDAFQRFSIPVNVGPGNHDTLAAFTVGVPRIGVSTSRAIEVGSWCFLFADSNAGVLVQDETGRHVDPPAYGDRLHSNGRLGAREAAWIKQMCETTQADHVFLWIHHPPAAPVPLTADADYETEWQALLPQLPKVRGIGAGHTHVPDDYEFNGVPVFVAPSFKNNFDLSAHTTLPPGYRTFEFNNDGSVTSSVELVEADHWPRFPLPRSVQALFSGELSYEEFDAIVARRNKRLTD